MRLYIFLISLAVVLVGCASVPKLTTDAKHIPDGVYIPNPKKVFFAGFTIDVKGDRFKMQDFTDVLSDQQPNPATGVIRKSAERFEFVDHGNVISVWFLGSLNGSPVLWSQDGFERCRKGEESKPLDILYLRKA